MLRRRVSAAFLEDGRNGSASIRRMQRPDESTVASPFRPATPEKTEVPLDITDDIISGAKMPL
jgi:hypothetical protein